MTSNTFTFYNNNSIWALIEIPFPKTYRFYQYSDFATFRYTLYLIAPWESSFARIDQVPNYNVQVEPWWALYIIVEFLILTMLGHSHRFALNDSITSCCAGMLSQCFKFGGKAIACYGYIWVWDNYRIIELPWNSYWTWALCFFTQDFAYYIGHRAIHEIGIFWGMHTIHHSSQYFNLSTSFRQAAIQDAGLAFYDILQAFFIPPPIFLVHRYFSEIFQFWMHTSLLGSLGPLGWLFNTPSHHRVHHGRNLYCIDRNFGGVLIIWDRIFGTFEAERLNDPPIYGLVKNERSFNQIWLQFHSLKEFLLNKWREKDKNGQPIYPKTIDKLKAMFFPPAWSPGMPVRYFCHWFYLPHSSYQIPLSETNPQIYNPRLPFWLKAYIFCHFLLLLAFFLHFEYDRAQMDWHEFILKLGFFILTMQSFGAFFDLRRWAPSMELFRCAAALLHYIYKIAFDEIRFYRIFEGTIFTISALFWIYRICSKISRQRRKVGNVAKIKPENWRRKA